MPTYTPQYHNPRVAAPRNRRRSVACVSLRSPVVSSSLVLESRCALFATSRPPDMDSSVESHDTCPCLSVEKCPLTGVFTFYNNESMVCFKSPSGGLLPRSPVPSLPISSLYFFVHISFRRPGLPLRGRRA